MFRAVVECSVAVHGRPQRLWVPPPWHHVVMTGGALRGRRIERNAIALLLARVAASVAMTAVIAISAYRLSIEDFGLVTSTLAAGFLVNTVVTFGTDTLITRSVAANGRAAGAIASASLRLQLALSVLIAGVAGVAVLLGAPLVLLVQALSLLPLAVVTVAGAVLRGRQEMEPLLGAALLAGVVTLGSAVIGFSIGSGPLVPIVSIAAGAVVSAWWLGRRARRHIDPSSQPLAFRQLLRDTAPFAGMVILAAIGAQGGLLLVEFLADEPTGGYGAAIRLAEASRLLPAAVIGAFFPAMMSGLHHTDRYRHWMRLLGLYALVATVALIGAAGVLNRWVFDSQPDGALLIRVLALTLGLTVVRLSLSFEAIADDRERVVLLSAAAGTAILLIGGAIAAGPAGAAGVAWAQVAGVAAAVFVLAVSRRSASTSPSGTAAAAIDPGKLRSRFGQPE